MEREKQETDLSAAAYVGRGTTSFDRGRTAPHRCFCRRRGFADIDTGFSLSAGFIGTGNACACPQSETGEKRKILHHFLPAFRYFALAGSDRHYSFCISGRGTDGQGLRQTFSHCHYKRAGGKQLPLKKTFIFLFLDFLRGSATAVFIRKHNK